ncbi:hypothetical protein BDN67DRAFT_985221 [Paxillus ammoniavirescens]|nr:hypothetical protein BDN67DRAFT_985221 [Paxillus ammoniavirescens]
MAMHEHDDAVQSPEGRPPHRVDEGCRRLEVEVRDDEGSRRVDREVEGTRDDEGSREVDREVDGMTNKEEEARTATNANENEPPPPIHHPAPPPAPPSPPHHPERRDNVNTMRSNKTAARPRADAVHDPGGQTVAPGSVPPSVRLKGERKRATSLNVEPDNVETNGNHIEEDHDDQKPSRNPVGMTDSDEHRPSKPTEPPDEEEGARGGNGEVTDESSRVDEPEVEEVEVEMKESR